MGHLQLLSLSRKPGKYARGLNLYLLSVTSTKYNAVIYRTHNL